ncbi:MAG TPA: hypothetical protein VFG04_18355 [Planctomycetaceae bacterium]|nr:hypothetical protein [Planctomycetaceae bacterium]
MPASFAGLAKTREARDLLDRWASERQPEASSARTPVATGRGGPRLGLGGVNLEAESTFNSGRSEDVVVRPRSEGSLQESHGSSRRFDAAQSLSGSSGAEPIRNDNAGFAAGNSSAGTQRISSRSESGRVHRIHGIDSAGPSFDVQGSLLETDRRKTNWTYALGQLLAYAGVALLTVGSTLVLWGYFGGPASYAPTGWLTTMAGQMILILGVVTLVSGGMEQTNEDVRVRIERLGERMIRIEQIARDHALRGPNVAADYSRAQAADVAARQESELRR